MKSDKRAKIILTAMGQTMDALDSYTATQTVAFSATVGTKRLKLNITAETKTENQNSGSYKNVTVSENETVYGGESISSVINSGYKNGYIFYNDYDSGLSFKTMISKQEYLDYITTQNVDLLAEAEKTVNSLKIDSEKLDGGWRVKIYGFSDDFVKTFEKSLGLHSVLGDYVLSDIEITVDTDSEMQCQKSSVRFLTDEAKAKIYLFACDRYDTVYSDFNATTVRDTNMGGYRDIGDLRGWLTIRNQWDLIKTSDGASLSIDSDIKETKIDVNQSVDLPDKESYKVTYRTQDSVFAYECYQTVDDKKYLYTYDDNMFCKYKVTESGEQEEDIMRSSDATQRATLYSIIDPYDLGEIMRNKKTQMLVMGDTYHFVLDKSISNAYPGARHIRYVARVTVNDGKIIKCEYDVYIDELRYISNGIHLVEIHTVVNYDFY